jgi:HK97 gp10 family phage protein
MADDDAVQKYLGDLPFRVKRKLAETIKAEADRLADAIKSATPVKTGALRDSVKVRRKRNELDLEVTAGGDTTIHGTSGPGGSADYGLFVEYGTTRTEARPFFYNTARAMMPQIRQNIEDAVAEALK